MATTLIVLAHPHRRSFAGDWADASARASAAAGHGVLWSDLSGGQFDPQEGAQHFDPDLSAGGFDPLKVHEAAVAAGRLPEDAASEMAKIRQADRIIFHFPIWWFAPPAVLKGWFDRVLMHGALHDVEHRFDRGRCRSKRALFCVTTGASAAESGPDGKEGNTRLLLWPAAQTLRYLGFEIALPEIVHGVHGYHEGAEKAALEARLREVLAAQDELIAGWDARPLIPFNPDADFDAAGRLRRDRPSHSPFIRHAE